MSNCNHQKNQITSDEESRVPVTIQKIHYGKVVRHIAASGDIEGYKTIKLGFMVAGKINYIAGPEGSSLKAGQLIASLDSENYSIAKEIADANLNQLRDEYQRLELMYKQKSVSDGDFSKISNALKVADAQQRLHEKNLADTRLFSPFSGVLLKKNAEVGEIIGTGLPLFIVSDIYKVKVSASIPESELRHLSKKQTANVHVLSLDSTIIGRIIEIGSVADPSTRTFTIKIELENQQLLLRPGMTAEVDITTDSISGKMYVPMETVLHDIDNSSYIYIVDSLKNKAFKRKVALGTITGNDIEIISGLRDGELVVVDGQHKLTNGTTVEVK
jgi:RND family efflux transporter MFP subunit